MHTFLKQKLESLQVDARTFFRFSYLFVFDRDGNVADDVKAYEAKGVLAPYVVNFLNHLRESEHNTKDFEYWKQRGWAK